MNTRDQILAAHEAIKEAATMCGRIYTQPALIDVHHMLEVAKREVVEVARVRLEVVD